MNTIRRASYQPVMWSFVWLLGLMGQALAAANAPEPTSPAAAGPSGFAPERFDLLVQGLEFGAPPAQLDQLYSKAMRDYYQPRIRAAADASTKDQLSAEMRLKIDEFAKNQVEFKGASGWAVTVLADEYVDGVGQVMREIRQGAMKRYLLYHGGKLWKYILTVEEPKNFSELLVQLQKIYGKPAEVDGSPTPAGGPPEGTEQVIWRVAAPKKGAPTETLTLVVEDRMQAFQCHALKWIYQPLEVEVAKVRKPKDTGDDAALDAIINDIRTPGRNVDPSNAVDDVLHQK